MHLFVRGRVFMLELLGGREQRRVFIWFLPLEPYILWVTRKVLIVFVLSNCLSFADILTGQLGSQCCYGLWRESDLCKQPSSALGQLCKLGEETNLFMPQFVHL